MEVNDKTLTEILRLSQESNRILHKMRRNAFWGGLIKLIIYVVIFVVTPLWLYATYLAPVVESMSKTMQQIQGTGAQAQAQFSDFQKMWEDLQKRLPEFMQPKS
jgi:galactitol-specific phosphotransferase system IIC component